MTENRDRIRRINFLKKVVAVQECYLEHKKEYNTTRYVHREYIAPTFFISIRTLYQYLGINAKRELRQLTEEEPQNN